MKPRKSHKSRPKLSFAVDRAEIDISSDWVDAITQTREFPAPEPAVLVDEHNHATVVDAATVENTATAVNIAPVADSATVANCATVAPDATPESLQRDSIVAFVATVDTTTTVVSEATVAQPAPVSRVPRPRPIRRITDGLTPGQFAVYSLMFDRGEAQPTTKARLYRGGYLDLCHLTGLSKRGIQNIVAELQSKNVLSIHQPPGHHKTQTTVYQVDAEDEVVSAWFLRGYRFALGKGKRLIESATVAVST